MAKKEKKTQRSAERELAFRSVFQLSFHQEITDAEAGIQAFLEEETAEQTEDSLSVSGGSFSEALTRAVLDRHEEIDGIIKDYIKDSWSIERIPNVEKAVLRLSVAEMLYLDTPKEIAINEAVMLVKKYADEDAHRFVNGILNHFAEDHL